MINTARQMIEEEGLENLSLSKLAAQFDVKAPSLYKHVENKAAILEAVSYATYRELSEAILKKTASINDPIERVKMFARVYREFAQNHPVTYHLALTSDMRGDEDVLAALGQELEAIMRPIVGENDTLTALRGLWAQVHGFVMLEINQQMRRGGDLDAAFEAVIDAFIRGWQMPHR